MEIYHTMTDIDNIIYDLTAEQRAQLKVYKDKWTSIGLSTERVDREKARAAVELMYKTGGHEPPEEIVFVGGPLEAVEFLRARGVEKPIDEVINRSSHGNQMAWQLGLF